MRVAQPAILPRLFFVPMHLNESHAEQHQDCYGASEKTLRSAGHTVAMIVPCPWNMQIRKTEGGTQQKKIIVFILSG